MASRNAVIMEVVQYLNTIGAVHSASEVQSHMIRRHHESAHHRQLMENYYLARESQQLRCEAWALGYHAEEAEYYATHEVKITFKAWLRCHSRTGADWPGQG